ncbi:Mannitol-specific cryptic phosphotransferase enzyme IIA component [Klebsiella quasivariicola]|uniref:Mannitol-specific cryptic phosphotransferase enzyme IIA component n=1 Tax=Klebsiella quasivariicola TaxID=2026240 RepID=A0ABY6X8G3_9ENTR|nr:Mannitol-specific cryptic phosphotransferase enzyme IIA component [Klebsiella quasivariicola]VVK25425.1 Mannitol-specific cryptic phosphotransferase enzyme IIA component [Klebsiella quasivariicola]
MISDWLTPDKINVINTIDTWENAIRLAAEPLLAQEYITAILKSHEEIGPYYVLAPGLAMPHARPEQGVLRN